MHFCLGNTLLIVSGRNDRYPTYSIMLCKLTTIMISNFFLNSSKYD